MSAAPSSPYVRLRAYSEGEQGIFFGRAREITELLRLVEGDSVSILYGLSGVGKSSLLNAGLFPRLRDRNFLPVRVRLEHTEGGEGLTSQVLRAVEEAAERAGVALPKRGPAETLWEYFHQRKRVELWTMDHRLLIPVLALDQFEEFFTLGHESPQLRERGEFFREELFSLIENSPSGKTRDASRLQPREWDRAAVPLRVLLIMREDFIAQLLPIVDSLAKRIPGIHRQTLRLIPLELEAAREIIECPAKVLGIIPPEQAAADAILSRAQSPTSSGDRKIEPARLGLLLTAIENERVKRRLPQITVELAQIKGEDLFTRTLEDAFFGLDRRVRRFVEQQMVTPAGYRTPVTEDQAERAEIQIEQLEELVKRGLLTKRSGLPARYELMHDLLCPTLVHSRKEGLQKAAGLMSNLGRRGGTEANPTFLEPPSEYFWDDLLDLMEQGRILPIVGEKCITFGPDDQSLYPWLARELAASLSLEPDVLGQSPTLRSVSTQFLLSGGLLRGVYPRLARILRDSFLTPGNSLKQLASIDAFRLYLSTTLDPLLKQAIDECRFRGQSRTETVAFSLSCQVNDLPAPARDLSTPTVFHLFGRATPGSDEYVLTEEDLLEFLVALPRSLNTSLRHLSRELQSMAVLTLGLDYTDWVMRILLRILKQEHFSGIRERIWLIEEAAMTDRASMVLFFGECGANLQVIYQPLAAFCAELAGRWEARRATHSRTALEDEPSAHELSAEGLIFISYACEDEAAARQIKADLEAAGGLVFFDRQRLARTQIWEDALRDQVRRCSVFIAVISAFTEASVASYFHLERHFAAIRARSFRRDFEFYVQVVIDATPPAPLRSEPPDFASTRGLCCPGGHLSAEVANWVVKLQHAYRCNAK